MVAVCFWSTFTALSVQLFYWSVWKLGKSRLNDQADSSPSWVRTGARCQPISVYTIDTMGYTLRHV